MVGICFGLAASIVFAVSRVSRDFFIAGAIDSGFGAFSVSLRATLMKLVEADEAANSNAISFAIEGTLYHLYGVLYSYIYSVTVETCAGAFYFVTSACYAYSLAAVFGLFFIHRNVSRRPAPVSASTISSILDKY